MLVTRGARQLCHLLQQRRQNQMERAQLRQVQLLVQLQRNPGQEQAQGQEQHALRPCSGTTRWELAASSWALHKQQSASSAGWALMHLHAAMLASYIHHEHKMDQTLTCKATVADTARAAAACATHPMVAAPLLAPQNCLHKQHAGRYYASGASGCMLKEQQLDVGARLPSNGEQSELQDSVCGMAGMWKSRAYRCLYVASKPVCGLPLQAQGLEFGVIREIVLSKGQLHIAALQSRTLCLQTHCHAF